MIDAYDVTVFDRTHAQLEELLLFCLAVAGKKASMIAKKLEALLGGRDAGETPFSYVARLDACGELEASLRAVGMGKYRVLCRAYPEVARRFAGRLEEVSAVELETVVGIGPKTARYFLLHSRRDPGAIAVIDTHVMKYLRHIGHEVPARLPTRSQYPRLEALMIAAASASGMSMADFDLAVWAHYASRGVSPLPANVHPEASR